MEINFIAGAVAGAIVALLMRWWIPPTDCDRRLAELEAQVDREREEYEARIAELESRIEFLVGELQRTGGKIAALEHSTPLATTTNGATKRLLFICGEDATLVDADRQSLRRANIPFHRILNATRTMILDELRRRRQDGTLYPWLHITAHAGQDGIALGDGIAPPAWWHEQLIGVRVVFLATCQSSAVADALAGLCTVVFVHEDIGNRDASDFTYAFWRRMYEHNDPVLAYRQAVQEAPQVAEFTDIRQH